MSRATLAETLFPGNANPVTALDRLGDKGRLYEKQIRDLSWRLFIAEGAALSPSSWKVPAAPQLTAYNIYGTGVTINYAASRVRLLNLTSGERREFEFAELAPGRAIHAKINETISAMA